MVNYECLNSDHDDFVADLIEHGKNAVLVNAAPYGTRAKRPEGTIVLTENIVSGLQNDTHMKFSYFHGLDPRTLVEKVILPCVVQPLLMEEGKHVVWLVSDAKADYIKAVLDRIVPDPKLELRHLAKLSDLQMHVFSNIRRKVVLCFNEMDFDRGVLPICDVFIYFSLYSCPNTRIEKRIFDGRACSATARVLYVGNDSSSNTIKACESLAFLVVEHLENIMYKPLLDEILHSYLEGKQSSNDEDEDDEMGGEETFLKNVFAFTDNALPNNYILQFIEYNIGTPERHISLEDAWWSLGANHSLPKVAIFCYTHSRVNFKKIVQYTAGWKSVNEHKQLTVLILIAPSLLTYTNEALCAYRSDYHKSVRDDLKADDDVAKQYAIDPETQAATKTTTEDKLCDLIMKILLACENFCKLRQSSYRPFFHERELLLFVEKIHPKLTRHIVAMFLKKCLPFVCRDNKQYVCLRLFDKKNVFVVKYDRRKYLDLESITGVAFPNYISRYIKQIEEEYAT